MPLFEDRRREYTRTYYQRNREKLRAYQKDWRSKHRRATRGEYSFKLNLRDRFGLTVEQYNSMLEAQGGVCAICKRPKRKRRLAVDHDHKTGMIRGLLCSPCNTSLGGFGDNSETLTNAIVYLEKHR